MSDHVTDIHSGQVELQPAGLEAGGVEELVYQGHQPVGVLGDAAHKLLLDRRVLHLVPLQKLDKARDRVQGRAQFMRETGDEVILYLRQLTLDVQGPLALDHRAEHAGHGFHGVHHQRRPGALGGAVFELDVAPPFAADLDGHGQHRADLQQGEHRLLTGREITARARDEPACLEQLRPALQAARHQWHDLELHAVETRRNALGCPLIAHAGVYFAGVIGLIFDDTDAADTHRLAQLRQYVADALIWRGCLEEMFGSRTDYLQNGAGLALGRILRRLSSGLRLPGGRAITQTGVGHHSPQLSVSYGSDPIASRPAVLIRYQKAPSGSEHTIFDKSPPLC